MTPETFAKAKAMFGPHKLVDLVMLMGNYAGTAALLARLRHAVARGQRAAAADPVKRRGRSASHRDSSLVCGGRLVQHQFAVSGLFLRAFISQFRRQTERASHEARQPGPRPNASQAEFFGSTAKR